MYLIVYLIFVHLMQFYNIRFSKNNYNIIDKLLILLIYFNDLIVDFTSLKIKNNKYLKK